MKAKDSLRLGVVRLIKSEIKNKEIELIRPLTEPEFIALLATMVKKRKESIEQYTKGGRADLAAGEENELKIVSEYLPQALSDAEVTAMINEAKVKTGASGPKDMGLIMKELKEKCAGRVDGKILSDKVKAALC